MRPDQKDEDSLPPYEVLDAILERYAVESQSAAEIVGGFDEATKKRVVRLIDLNEYKRRRARLEGHQQGFAGRRIPVAKDTG